MGLCVSRMDIYLNTHSAPFGNFEYVNDVSLCTGGEMNYNTHWEFFYTSREIDQVRFFLLLVFFFLAPVSNHPHIIGISGIPLGTRMYV